MCMSLFIVRHLYEILKNVVFFDHYILPSTDTLIGLAIYSKILHKMQSTDGILEWHHPAIATVCWCESHTVGLSFLCHLYEKLENVIFLDHCILPSTDTLIGLAIYSKFLHKMQSTDGILDCHPIELRTVGYLAWLNIELRVIMHELTFVLDKTSSVFLVDWWIL